MAESLKADTYGAPNNMKNEHAVTMGREPQGSAYEITRDAPTGSPPEQEYGYKLATAPAQENMREEVKFMAWQEPMKKIMKFYRAVGGPGLTNLDTYLCADPIFGNRCACNKQQVEPILKEFPGLTRIEKRCCCCERENAFLGFGLGSGNHNFCVMCPYPIQKHNPDFKDLLFDANGARVPGADNLDYWIIVGNPCWNPCCPSPHFQNVIVQYTLCDDYGCGFREAYWKKHLVH